MAAAQRMSEADRQRVAVAFHEAGHAVAAVVFGGRLKQAVLEDNPRAEYDDCPERHSASITYAGPWAEACWLSGGRPGQREIHRALETSVSDHKTLVAAGWPAMDLGVVPLLQRCWPAVKTVAKRLYFDGQAGHGDVCAALGLTDEGGPGSFELANIRAGLCGTVA